MRKIWLIAWSTYKQRVRSGTFLMLTLGIPVLMVLAGAVPFFTQGFGDELPVVGYIDQTGQLASVEAVTVDEQTLVLRAFDEPAQAQEAYQQGEIGGYLVIPAGYYEGEQTHYYAEEAPNASLTQGLQTFMRQAMLPGAPEWILKRLNDPKNRTFVSLESGESVQEGPALILRIATPAGLAILMALALLFTSSQMGAAVVREKDQRAMEMIITSIRTSQLVAGKVLGITLLSLTQLTVWGTGIAIAIILLLAGNVEPGSITLPWNAFFWAFMLGVPGYFLYAVVASGLGIIAGDTQQAQQLAGFLGFIGMVPLWLSGMILDSPNSATAVGLSLFPFTAPIFTLFRMSLTKVPLWQLVTSFGILILSLLAGIWLVTRIFRAAVLMYGQTLRPREIWRALKQS
jgi:ABC-2 type transport system permease protein